MPIFLTSTKKKEFDVSYNRYVIMNTFLPFNFVSQNIIYKQSLFRSFFFFLSFSTKRKIWKNNATRQTNQTCSSKALPCSSQTLILFKRRKKKHPPNFQDYTYAYQFYFFLNMVLIYTYIRNLVFIHIPYTIVIHFSFLLNLFSFYYTYVHILFSLSLSL